jgi:porin
MVSRYALLFVNTAFGWPMLPSADLLSGGPAYPLSSLGARISAQPTDSITLLGGVFNDNPSSITFSSPEDSQRLNDHGTNFRLSDKPLVIAEIQYSRPALGDMHYASQPDTLPGTYKLGAWYDFRNFDDQKTDNTGLPLADPASSGIPAHRRGNYSVYAVIDQLVWRPDEESSQGVGVFMRAMGTPQDRNVIDFSLNLGLTLKAPFAGRDSDTLGLGYGWANVSSSASSFDRYTNQVNATDAPVRSREQFIELTYQYQVTSWLQLQPDAQYVFNPGAGISDPNNPASTKKIGNEAVFGVRTNIAF